MNFVDHGIFHKYAGGTKRFGDSAVYFESDQLSDFYETILDIVEVEGSQIIATTKDMAGFLADPTTGDILSASSSIDALAPDGKRLITVSPASAAGDLISAIIGISHRWDGSEIVEKNPDPAQPVFIATRVQVEIWLDRNGFVDGFNHPGIIAAAAAAGSEAQIRLRSGTRFTSDDVFLTAAAPLLGIPDLARAIQEASEI